MRYAVLGGGKRIRPLLCHASGSIFAASENVLDNAAAAVELIHIYSLVHDDLPCMDDDVLRRGKPTCHVAFDEATALLVGDALQALAFQVLTSKIDQFDAIQQLSMLRTLAIAAGTSGMVGGQALDIAAVGKLLTIAELELMHLQKTGALIRAAVLLGAFAGNASTAEIDLLTHFANRSGLLFQVVDDILDVDGDTNTLGKTAGKDAFQEKPTYVSLLGLAQAKELARDLLQEAHESLAPFGERATRLHELADFIVNRKF
jgi:farnesyl diphosphate synthase